MVVVILLAVLITAGALAAITLSSPGQHRRAGEITTTTTSSRPGPNPDSTGVAVASTVTPEPASKAVGPRAIRTVACPSTYGVTGENAGPVQPATLTIDTTATLASQLTFYTNDTRTLAPVLGPKGWDCEAIIATDGSASITVYPPGHAPPEGGPIAGQQVVEASSAGACQGCVYAAVCALAPSAAAQLGYASTGIGCQGIPNGQTTDWIKGSPQSIQTASPDVIAFQQPTSPEPTNGVVLFQYSRPPGPGGSEAEDLCVLPPSDHPLCRVILDQFITSDWRIDA